MTKSARTTRHGIAFVTLTTRDRRPVFEVARVADLFVDTLLHYRTLGHYKLHAYVVLPDHVHLLLTPQSHTLDQAVELIKHGFAYRLDAQLPVWQNGFTGYSVATLHDLEIVRAFIHQLPVRAHLVAAAELYPHSSAYRRPALALVQGSGPALMQGSGPALVQPGPAPVQSRPGPTPDHPPAGSAQRTA